MLEIKDLHVNYGAVHALNGVSMTVKDGEIVSLIGANGAGKTTTLRTITGLEKAVRDLTVIALNRMGTEGEKARSEGGENYTFDDAPKQIYDTMNRFRLARVGGKAFEASKK